MSLYDNLILYYTRNYLFIKKTHDTLLYGAIRPDKTPEKFQVPVPSKAWKFESSSGQTAILPSLNECKINTPQAGLSVHDKV
jgi:hypothetical protein